MLKRPGIAVLLVLFALIPVGLSACGGDGNSEDPVPTTEEPAAASKLTQAELISTGDGICAEVNAAIGSIQASDLADDTTRATQVADLYAGLADSLEGLGTPSDGEPPTDVIAAARTLGDVDTADETALGTFQTAASDYGMLTCAEAPAAPVDTGTDGGTSVPTDPGTGDPVPAPVPEPEPVPAPAQVPSPTPPSGGGVAPVPPDTGGGTGGSGGSSGGSSGGISPG